MTKDATIYGLSLFNASADVRNTMHDAIYKGLDDGYLHPVVSRKFELADAPNAHRKVIESQGFRQDRTYPRLIFLARLVLF